MTMDSNERGSLEGPKNLCLEKSSYENLRIFAKATDLENNI
jgi:hypothetical protein